ERVNPKRHVESPQTVFATSVFALEEEAALGFAAVIGLAAQLHAPADVEVDPGLAGPGLVALFQREISAVVEIFAGRHRRAAVVIGPDVEIVDADRAPQRLEKRRAATRAGKRCRGVGELRDL